MLPGAATLHPALPRCHPALPVTPPLTPPCASSHTHTHIRTHTHRLSGPVPSFKPAQWQLLALALLAALSRHHIPALRTSLLAAAPPATAAAGATAASGAGAGDAASGEGAAAAAPAAAVGEGAGGCVPRLRAGASLHAASAHPRLLGLLERTGFDVHYLSALVDLISSPDF